MAQVPLPILIRVPVARDSKSAVILVSECLDGRKRRVIVSGRRNAHRCLKRSSRLNTNTPTTALANAEIATWLQLHSSDCRSSPCPTP